MLNLDKYSTGEIANGSVPRDLTADLDGWKQTLNQQFGQFDLYAFLSTFAPNEPSLAILGSQGWGAGSVRTYTDSADSNRNVVQLFLSFDSDEDLVKFGAAYAVLNLVHGVDLSKLDKGTTVRWDTGQKFGPLAAITVDPRLPNVEIHLGSDEAVLAATTPNLPSPAPSATIAP